MGWEDREYNQTWNDEPPPAAGLGPPPPAITLSLMILHGVGFLIYAMMRHDVGRAAADMMQLDAEHPHWIAVLVHPFASPGPLGFGFLGLLLTLYVLWKVVGPLEERFGWKTVFATYWGGNLACGLAYLAYIYAIPTLATKPLAGPIGAFAAVCGLMLVHDRGEGIVIAGRWWPTAHLMAGLLGLLALLNLVLGGFGALGWLLAVVFAAGLVPLVNSSVGVLSALRSPERVVAQEGRPSPRRPASTLPAEDDLDELLAKISRDGIGSLTADERGRLERAREARLRNRR